MAHLQLLKNPHIADQENPDPEFGELSSKAYGHFKANRSNLTLVLARPMKEWSAYETKRNRLNGPSGSGLSLCREIEDSPMLQVVGIWSQKTGRDTLMSPQQLGVCGLHKALPVLSLLYCTDPSKLGERIEREFLPAYLPLYQKCLEKKRNSSLQMP